MRYAIELDGKDRVRIHLATKLPEIGVWVARGEETCEAVCIRERLLAINGVVDVYTIGQCLTFKRGGAFTVDELLPQVLDVLAKQLKIESWELVESYR